MTRRKKGVDLIDHDLAQTEKLLVKTNHRAMKTSHLNILLTWLYARGAKVHHADRTYTKELIQNRACVGLAIATTHVSGQRNTKPWTDANTTLPKWMLRDGPRAVTTNQMETTMVKATHNQAVAQVHQRHAHVTPIGMKCFDHRKSK